MANFQTTFDETGYIRHRHLPRGDAARVGRQTIERRAQIIEVLPEPFRPTADAILTALEGLVPDLENSILPALRPEDGIANAPDEVRALISAPVELTNPAMFNHLLDRYVRKLDLCLEGAVLGPDTSPVTRSARELREVLFPEGRAFLTWSNLRQWHHIHNVFNRISDEHMALVRRAGVETDVEHIQILNRHYATMLGVDLDHIDDIVENNPELDDDPSNNNIPQIQAEVLSNLIRLLLLANVAFPEREQAASRRLVSAPLLNELERRRAARSSG